MKNSFGGMLLLLLVITLARNLFARQRWPLRSASPQASIVSSQVSVRDIQIVHAESQYP